MKANRIAALWLPLLSRLWVLGFMVASLTIESCLAQIGINAKIDGSIRQIGTIEVSNLSPKNPATVFAEFDFDNGYGYLDRWYNFQWLQVEVKYTVNGVDQARDTLNGTLPAIDGQPGAQFDDKPFALNTDIYENSWLRVSQRKAHLDESWACFEDTPADDDKDSQIYFRTFLVLENVTDPALTSNSLCVLGWFDWVYDNMKNYKDGKSVIGTTSGVVDDGMVDLINASLANAGGPGFPGYSAVLDCNLTACVPEAKSLMPICFGFAFLLVGRASRKDTRPSGSLACL